METNPYKAPTDEQQDRDQAVRSARRPVWRTIPAAVFGLLGVIVTGIGLLMLVQGGYLAFDDAAQLGWLPAFLFLMVYAMVIAGGCSWIASAIAFWRCRWIKACAYIALGAVTVTAAVVAMFGWMLI